MVMDASFGPKKPSSKWVSSNGLGDEEKGMDTQETVDLPKMVQVTERKMEVGKRKMTGEAVVELSSAIKSFGKSKNKKMVLDNLNMRVNHGEIYGLLGASGCGKTTLLSVVVGRHVLDSGDLLVLGGLPGDGKCGVPGAKVGYMPQELALYGEFSIVETLQYFGRIYGMSSKEIITEMEFLLKFLDLPPQKRIISTLSGGQQRRVSFAVALMHNPDLLILDEPTVGVDPVLRQSIWQHLRHLSSSRSKTIIITTHYIEEARQADCVGMMRNGRLLTEDSPQSLLVNSGLVTLEDVFLKLCYQETGKDIPKTSPPQEEVTQLRKSMIKHIKNQAQVGIVGLCNENQEKVSPMPNTNVSIHKSEKSTCHFMSFQILWALLAKNFLKLQRNLPMLLFIFLLPAIQVVFFCIAIGQEPKNLPLSVVNYESLSGCPDSLPPSCNYTFLSCQYLYHLDKVDLLVYHNSEEEGLASVENGETWGLLVVQSNFSDAFITRLWSAIDADNQTMFDSSVVTKLDMSNQQVAITLQSRIMDTFDKFSRGLLVACDFPEEAASIPVIFDSPVYGKEEPSFTEFMAPGMIILIIYFLAVALTGESFIQERSSGLLVRSWVAGVKPIEILASHILAQCLVMSVQTAITLITIIYLFSIPCLGPIHWLAIIALLQGLAGMSFGFLISALCDSQAVAMQLSIGSFYPNLLLSGILWPLEGMPSYLQTIASLLPNTQACQAMRDIMLRGWGVDREEVYFGLVSSSVWILIFLSLSLVVVKFKS